MKNIEQGYLWLCPCCNYEHDGDKAKIKRLEQRLHQHDAELLASATYIKCAKCGKPALRYSSTIDGLRCQSCGVAYLNCEQVKKRETYLTAEVVDRVHDQLATSEWHKGWAAAVEAGESNKERLIAEVQEPLVEALEKLHSLIWNAGHIGHMRKIIDDALDKIKK